MICKQDLKNNWFMQLRIPTVWMDGQIFAVEIGYNQISPGMHQTMLRDVYILHYVISGRGRFMQTDFSAGDGYLVAANEKEDIIADQNDPYETIWIMFRGNNVAQLLTECGLSACNHVFHFRNARKCIEILRKNLSEHYENPWAETMKMNAVLFELLSVHMEENKKKIRPAKSDICENVAKFMEENYPHSIRIKELSDRFHISQSRLIALFHEQYGTSPQEYLMTLRIERAKDLLQNHHVTVKEASLSVGIHNPLYFSRLFKKKNGIAPSAWRESESVIPFSGNDSGYFRSDV